MEEGACGALFRWRTDKIPIMNARIRFWLAIAVLGLLMTGPFWLTSAVLMADMKPEERDVLAHVLLPRLPLGALITALGFALGVAMLRGLFRQYVQGLLGMAEMLRVMHSANREFRVEPSGPPEVRQLAAAANALAQQRDDLMTDVEAQIARARASVEEDKNRLAALVADLPQPVIVCNLDGRILLYNNRARLQAKALSPDAAAFVGLGRSIYGVLDRALIVHALETLQQRLEREGSQPLAHFVTPTRAGQLIRVQMTPVVAAQANGAARTISGYVITLENISRYLENDAGCDLIMMELAKSGLSEIAGVRAALRTLAERLSPEDRPQAAAVEAAIDGLGRQLDAAADRYAKSVKTRWPLEEMLAEDLVFAVRRRIEARTTLTIKVDGVEAGLWVKVDSYSLVQAMSFLAARLEDDYGVRLVRLHVTSAGSMVHLDLLWTGTAVSTETLISWQIEPMSVGGETSPLTLRDVAERHGGQLSCGRETATQQSLFRLQIPVAVAQDIVEALPQVQVESRPEFYDFNLFLRGGEEHDLDDRPLAELTYTVFDTETTGLEPSQGDEIIQFGAARIVGSRLLRRENFDQLVDPRIPLKPEGIPIHGITEEMLAGQPSIDVVLPRFHRFCEDTVLVAHNAAFDLRFLQMKESSTGIRFTQPVLDTLLLSAVIHPNQESHRLESIAERFGINVIGRHTALGDAFVTGEVFLKMVPLLADMGILTLRQALDAAQKTYYARVKY
jgi:DNA polymerase-3 subunit epsilon